MEKEPPVNAGIPDRIALCLDILVNVVILGPDSAVVLTLTEARHTVGTDPCLRWRFEGPGHLPDPLVAWHYFRLPFEAFSDLWTRATRDGRIDQTEEGFLLWLQGARVTPPPEPLADALLTCLNALDPLAAAREGLALLDGNTTPQPANIERVLREAVATQAGELEREGIRVEVSVPAELSPLSVRRNRLTAFVAALLDYVRWHARAGAHVDLCLEYEARARKLNLLIDIQAEAAHFSPTFHVASLRRAIADHGGAFSIDTAGDTATIIATLLDPVGASLDAWIPGWGHFSARGQQMLRLLKGVDVAGTSRLPEEVILGGVLEEELERRLLPRLSAPLARNVAKELEATTRKHALANAERAEKALAQIARGKPKKEICQPAHAAEIVWAFARTERGREALELHDLPEPELRPFCEAFLAAPPNYLTALRYLARWRA
ncbi:MAG: hypothetical protein HYZ00_02435 [Candidatus Hydrogenedentes bacterium]|nr:hypothetical protein [Candidatus Hydrogenedentota bacterium]